MAENLLLISILALGLLCLVIAFVAKYKDDRCKQACTSIVTAEISEIKEDDGYWFYPLLLWYIIKYYAPIYRYVFNGKTYEVPGDACSENKHKVGELIDINVNPDCPENFYDPEDMIKSQKFATHFLVAGIVILGIVGVVIAL